MLNINTQVGQSIIIGDIAKLTITGILSEREEITFQVIWDKDGSRHNMEFNRHVGDNEPVILNVSLEIKSINTNGVQYVTLGFDAPREIKIQGSWKKETSISETNLVNMYDDSLVYYTKLNSKTALEGKLANRLDSILKGSVRTMTDLEIELLKRIINHVD